VDVARLFLLSLPLLVWWSPQSASGASFVFIDSRDEATLLPQHLVNRDLSTQLGEPEQSFRLGRLGEHWSTAADLAIGTQQVPLGGRQTSFHGYFLASTYASVIAWPGIEANLNVLFLNPSASMPYRSASHVNAGLALHASFDAAWLAGHPLRLHVLGTDLDWVTLGRGLLIERTPLEGVVLAASWRDLELRWMFAGRAFWNDDNLVATTLSTLGGRLQLMNVEWLTDRNAVDARYLNASFGVPLLSRFFVGAEGSVRYDKGMARARGAALLRADATERRQRFELHLGYQFRWYQDGFGPRDDLKAPTSTFNVPNREDVYVTNSYEYLGISRLYAQWSHTVMFEGRIWLTQRLQLFADTEAWLRWAVCRGTPWVVYTSSGFRAPGRVLTGYYRSGLRLFPWPGLPHRLSVYFTNKQVSSTGTPGIEVERRFETGTNWILFTMEAFL
jgi:hypothetical protein